MGKYNRGDYNSGGMKAFVFAMVFTCAFFIYIAFFHPGVDLKEIPQDKAPEAAAAAEAPTPAPAATPAANFDVNKVEKPWETSPEMVAHGQALYGTSTCAVCHGDKGEGNGAGAAGLNPKPRNLVEGAWKKGGSSVALFDTLTNGFAPGSSMASFKHIPARDRWALVHFIRSITKNKVEDNPAELEEAGKKSLM